MKLFKDQRNRIHAFEADGSQDGLITEEMTPVTDAEADALRFPPKQPEQIKADRIAGIKQALAGIDAKKVRATTDAVLLGDKTRLQALEDQAATLRAELATL